ncbi:hypothetical protein C2G38_2031484 [Gigaspora rosea]|uniref:Uncharacterized protein n=1 Tax=Gigaspora rosea TaxID=44941 RepID=A0A397VT55_9GLOM|nr:hypothetical protein C2G38_2031484 [Gigaspora rosea]
MTPPVSPLKNLNMENERIVKKITLNPHVVYYIIWIKQQDGQVEIRVDHAIEAIEKRNSPQPRPQPKCKDQTMYEINACMINTCQCARISGIQARIKTGLEVMGHTSGMYNFGYCYNEGIGQKE